MGVTVPELFEKAPLVITGEVTAIEPLGVETTLVYPTLRGATFHWLRVTLVVSTVLKGAFTEKSIDVAMLAVKKAPADGLDDPPRMLSPRKWHKYVMFLAPSPRKGVFVSIGAPYNEVDAIFILDRQAKLTMSSVAGQKELVWALITSDGEFSQSGAQAVARKLATQIGKQNSKLILPLEYRGETNAQGWFIDVPKSTPEPSRK